MGQRQLVKWLQVLKNVVARDGIEPPTPAFRAALSQSYLIESTISNPALTVQKLAQSATKCNHRLVSVCSPDCRLFSKGGGFVGLIFPLFGQSILGMRNDHTRQRSSV